MLTLLGKFLRKLRIDRDETMKDMARRFDMTAAYLSAIELNKRSVPKDLFSKINKEYSLDDSSVKELTHAVIMSCDEVVISLVGRSLEDRELVLRFHKVMLDEDKGKINELRKLLLLDL